MKAAYVALIASAHRSRLMLDYLLAEGISTEKVERVWAPARKKSPSASSARSLRYGAAALQHRSNKHAIR
ncbi:MAG TPA: hypothetical protein VH724_00960, partial [Candidatus Angelobacter sp.]|nr:hypothetical protein [Candidatus Angelobacter sp.]